MALAETRESIPTINRFVTLSVLPSERYLERDTVIRSFCTTLQSGREPTPEITMQFEAGVAQIAARTALRMDCTGDRVDFVVEEVVASLKIDILEGTFIPRSNTPVASYISQKARWTVLHERERSGVRSRRELHGDPDHLFSSHHKKPNNHSRPTEDRVIQKQTTQEILLYNANTLTPEQREVMALISDHSIEEITHILGITYREVVCRVHRARKSLREQFPDHAKPLRRHRGTNI